MYSADYKFKAFFNDPKNPVIDELNTGIATITTIKTTAKNASEYSVAPWPSFLESNVLILLIIIFLLLNKGFALLQSLCSLIFS